MTTPAKHLLARLGARAVAADTIAVRYLDHPPRPLFDIVLPGCFANFRGLRVVPAETNDRQRYAPPAALIGRRRRCGHAIAAGTRRNGRSRLGCEIAIAGPGTIAWPPAPAAP